jgi:hypothetical protein
MIIKYLIEENSGLVETFKILIERDKALDVGRNQRNFFHVTHFIMEWKKIGIKIIHVPSIGST